MDLEYLHITTSRGKMAVRKDKVITITEDSENKECLRIEIQRKNPNDYLVCKEDSVNAYHQLKFILKTERPYYK